jgi:hypothetical protein
MKAICLLSICFTSVAIHAESLTDFSQRGLEKWQYEVIENETRYTLVDYQQRPALKAVSQNSASGYVLEKDIDLLATPYLSWQWLALNKLPSLNERSKSGDDYVARVYVVIDGGLLLWRTKSLSYVWSSNEAKGEVWDNAFTGSNVQMVAVRGRDAQLNTWHEEKRNVYQDLITFFGDKGSDKANEKAYRYINMVAIMTDTDNSGLSATAFYGDIFISAQ